MIYSKMGPEVQAIFIKYNVIYMYYDEQQCIRMVSKGKSIRLIILYALYLKSAKKSGLHWYRFSYAYNSVYWIHYPVDMCIYQAMQTHF